MNWIKKKWFGKKAADPGFREDLGFNPNPLNQPTIVVDGNGWIPLSSAQPPFQQAVLVKAVNGLGLAVVGIGRRTENIHPDAHQEIWDCRFLEEVATAIYAWRPI